MRPYCYYQAIAGLIRQCKNLIIPLKTGRSGLINILLYDIFLKSTIPCKRKSSILRTTFSLPVMRESRSFEITCVARGH